MLLLITAIAGWAGVRKAGLNPGSSAQHGWVKAAPCSPGQGGLSLLCRDKGVRRHSPWLGHLTHCLKLEELRQHLYPLVMASEVKLFSRARTQERKPATPQLHQLHSLPAWRKSHFQDWQQPVQTSTEEATRSYNSWGWDPRAGQAPAEWLAFKVLIRFLITAKYFKLPKLEKIKPKGPPNELLTKMLIGKGFFSSLFFFLCEEKEVPVEDELWKKEMNRLYVCGAYFLLCLCSCTSLSEDFFQWLC